MNAIWSQANIKITLAAANIDEVDVSSLPDPLTSSTSILPDPEQASQMVLDITDAASKQKKFCTMNVFYVPVFLANATGDNSPAEGDTFLVPGLNGYTFIGTGIIDSLTKMPASSLPNILAHELGHQLGLKDLQLTSVSDSDLAYHLMSMFPMASGGTTIVPSEAGTARSSTFFQ